MKRAEQMSKAGKFASVVLVFAALCLAACDSTQSTAGGSISGSEIKLPVPDRIRAISALDPSGISAVAQINGEQVTLSRSGGSYRGNISVPARSTFNLVIEFSEQFADQKLVLASSEQSVTTGSDNQQVKLRRSSYDFNSHDTDNDSVSNIVEREEGTDPLDSSEAPGMVNLTVVARKPQTILQSNSFNDYFFEASVGSDIKVLSPVGNEFRQNFYVVDRAPLDVSVQMIESVTGDQLNVASQSRQLDSVSDQQTVIFTSDVYSTTDRDGDAQSDLAELVAGTDLTVANNPPTNTLTVQFSVPAEILNPETLYAEYRVDNQLVATIRNGDSFTATSNTVADSSIELDITLLDNFNNTPYVVTAAQRTVSINSSTQSINFAESDFSFAQDNDEDGTENYLEREAGTDPFNPPSIEPEPVSCTVEPLPAVTGLPDTTAVIENISGYVDCGGESYALNASADGFDWNLAADNISWLIPADSEAGDNFSYPLEVANPSVSTEVYATVTVNTQVDETECSETTIDAEIATAADIFVQNSRVFNTDELRVNASNRTTIIGFDVPAQDGELTAAALVLAVGEDGGSGVIGVYQDDGFDWNESDTSLDVPELNNLIGSRDGAWESDSTQSIGLDALFITESRVNLFLQQDAGGNDVEFTSSETNAPPVLVLQYSGCF